MENKAGKFGFSTGTCAFASSRLCVIEDRLELMPAKRMTFSFEEGEPITAVEHFLAEIKKFAGKHLFRIYFRGHGEPMNALVPSIGRKHYYVGKSMLFDRNRERELLARFRRYAYEHFQRLPTEWETLFLARHHGLPTRLLDWTANPLVALYFAAFYDNDEVVYRETEAKNFSTVKLNLNGTVWAIERRAETRHDLNVLTERRSPLQIPGIKLVYPFNPSPRMSAQSGMFTLLGDPWTDMAKAADETFPTNTLDISRLTRWSVTARNKLQIIIDLERLAVNSRTLFPDLDGLAKGLYQTEIIREITKG